MLGFVRMALLYVSSHSEREGSDGVVPEDDRDLTLGGSF